METLGIDIGGSGIKGAIVDTGTGKLISDRFRIPTPASREPHTLAEVIKQIQQHFKWKDNIGVAFPTVVINGKAMYNSNLHPSWKGTQIDDLFCEYCNQTITVINDADAAAIAEMRFGAGMHHNAGLVMVITIGTGLGSGVFYDGILIPNFELGHMKWTNGEIIEFWAADSARKKEGLEFDEWGARLNRFLQYVERIFSPDYLILGGGVSKKIHKFRDQLTIATPFVASEKLNNAGIIGAATHCAEHHK